MRPLCSALLLALAAQASGRDGWTGMTQDQWTRVPLAPLTKIDRDSQWTFLNERIICSGTKGHELLRSKKEFGDFVLEAEWRLEKLDGTPRYNSGIYVRTSANGVEFTQAQIGAGPEAWLFTDTLTGGVKKRINLREEVKAQPVKPPGEWNRYEITARGATIELKVNGEMASVFTQSERKRGFIGLEAEGFRIEFRNVRIRELR